MANLFSQLAGADPRVRDRLTRLWNKSRLRAGAEGPAELEVRAPIRPGLAFPGDGLLFAAVVAFLTLCCYVSLAHLAFPAAGQTPWARVFFAALAALIAGVTWQLARLRQAPLGDSASLPDPKVESPLVELHDFLATMRRELEQAAFRQRLLAHCLFGGLLLIVGWGTLLVVRGYGGFARLLITAASLSASFVFLNWRPYELATRRRRLAHQAAWVAEALSERIRRLDTESSSPDRTAQEWRLVQEALTGKLAPEGPLVEVPRRARRRRR